MSVRLVRIEDLVRDCGGSCSIFVLRHRYALRILSSHTFLVDEYTYADMLKHIYCGCACTYEYISMAVHMHVCV